ncbi:hypothetical protein [Cryptosporangium phraense]|uniref:Uncharacterized protein n=1 Tax=Cryptosporangium phraense TaxID=2593070 RepID=A0A545AUU1_9ACTN|nr:hypothetical protein [Cryptosporangium phraense]TQS44355.1 hypothetical protein FL583_15595 [Cryptosporangium phraense]
MTLSTVPQIVEFAERLGDATSLDPFSWSGRIDTDGALFVDNVEAAATPAEIAGAWAWLLSDQRARELTELQEAGVYLGGAFVDLFNDDGSERTTAPVQNLEPGERDRALASLIVTAAALRRRLHETAVAMVTLIAENAAEQRGDDEDDDL